MLAVLEVLCGHKKINRIFGQILLSKRRKVILTNEKKKKKKCSPPLLPLQRVKSRIIKNKEKESKKSK